ncbi:MAG: hypothetical protein VB036_09365, partial [Propionicimonas sp.]|nr:hypothetical protein [Propionicimonas sp.]
RERWFTKGLTETSMGQCNTWTVPAGQVRCSISAPSRPATGADCLPVSAAAGACYLPTPAGYRA